MLASVFQGGFALDSLFLQTLSDDLALGQVLIEHTLRLVQRLLNGAPLPDQFKLAAR